jgi:hypothetical protein
VTLKTHLVADRPLVRLHVQTLFSPERQGLNASTTGDRGFNKQLKKGDAKAANAGALARSRFIWPFEFAILHCFPSLPGSRPQRPLSLTRIRPVRRITVPIGGH